jgi:hypothetical protein
MKKQLFPIISSLAISLLASNLVQAADVLDFKDVSTTHPYYNAIKVLHNQSLLKGYPDNTFRPEQPLNRVEALKLIFEVAAIPLSNTVAAVNFSDTEKTAWYSGYLNKAAFLEIAAGYPDNTFRPANSVNLVEFLKMLLIGQKADFTGLNLEEKSYSDVSTDQWYIKYVNFAKTNDLLDVTKDNKIMPASPLTRGRAAEIIHRFRNMKANPTPVKKPSADLALYVSQSYKFALQYPKVWFYSTIENTNPAAIRTYGFGPKDLTSNPPVVTLELLPDVKNFPNNSVYNGFDYFREVGQDGNIILSAKINGSNRVYSLSGSLILEDTMVQMLTSLTSNIDGLETFNPAVKL